MTEQQQNSPERETSLDELNSEGVGGTTGNENTFEPEEVEDNSSDNALGNASENA